MTARILCVEDNPQNMRLVRKILTSQGYEVIEAEDGFSGLNMAETENPDLILMDINLPDIDGLEVTRRIKAQSRLNPIPIVALTANAMFGDEERCLAAGCDGYIAKPVSKQKLIANLRSYLDPTQDADTASPELETSNEDEIQEVLKLNKSVVKQESDESDKDIEAEKPSASAKIDNQDDVKNGEPKQDDALVVELNKPEASHTSTNTSENLPNVSAYRNSKRRYQFRRPTSKPSSDSDKEDETSSDKES